MTPEPRNLVTDLRPSFPHDPAGQPSIATYESEGFRYILQFDGGDLVGAVVFAEQYAPQLSGLLNKPAEPAKPKLEIASS